MARRISTFILTFVAVVGSCTLIHAAQASQHAVFPNNLERALDAQQPMKIPVSPALQNSSDRSLVSDKQAERSILQHLEARRTGATKSTTPEVVKHDVRPKSLDGSDGMTGGRNASLPPNPFAEASYRRRNIARPTTPPISETKEADWFGTVMTFPAQIESGAKIVVHQPDSMPGNEFSFIVENVGSEAAQAFSVEFETPADIFVLKAFPFNAEQSQHSVVVNFERLEAGHCSPVHIKTTAAKYSDFVIETRIRMEKSHEFKVRASELDDSALTSQLVDSQTEIQDSRTPYLLVSDNTSASPQQAPRLAYETPTSGVKKSVLSSSTNIENGIVLSTTLSGSESLVLGEEEDFEIIVANPTGQVATDIIIQLSLPEGLMVTNLDRQAWIDQELRTVSWKLDSIAVLEMDKIHYRVKTLGTSDQIQRVVVGMNNVFQGEIRMTSSVKPNWNPGEPTGPNPNNQ